MKTSAQFPALLRYHATVNPLIWIFPLVFGPQLLLFNPGRYYFNLELANLGILQMMCFPLVIAAFIFGTQIFAGMAAANASTNLQVQTYNPEFLFTRAVDRVNIYWARAALFGLLVLSPCAIWIASAFFKPSFLLEARPGETAFYLQNLPGSFVQETTKSGNAIILAPWGGLWLKLWGSFLFLYCALLSQFFVFLILPSRWRRWFYWGAFILTLALTILATLKGRVLKETGFLFSVHHPWLLLAGLVALAIVTQWFCRARFLKQEPA